MSRKKTAPAPLVERFWSKVSMKQLAGCWEWQGGRCKGYGYIRETDRTSRQLKAHRVAHALVNGPIAEGLVVRHRCDNPACCNPAHLEVGTQADNVRDMVERRRQGRCPGMQNGRSKLTAIEVEAIRSSDQRSAALAKVYGVSDVQISRIRRGQQWRAAA